MTPEEAREIDRLEFEADCRAARERAHALVARRYAERPKPITSPTPELVCARSTAERPRKRYEFKGQSLTLEEWGERYGRTAATISWRLRNGMTLEQALTIPRLKRGVNWQQQTGVVANFPEPVGTGGGPIAQDFTEIEFSK